MSRYYQSSYHGSNDYRKYRQERQGKNIEGSTPAQKKSFEQDVSDRSNLKRNQHIDHLHTFGKQIRHQKSTYRTHYGGNDNSYRQEYQLKNQDSSSKYEGGTLMSKRRPSVDYDQTKSINNKLSKYMMDAYGADKKSQLLNEKPRLAQALDPNESTKVSLSNLNKYANEREVFKDNDGFTEDFEDSIITRRRKYDNVKEIQNGSFSYLDESKPYNYSKKLKNLPEQKTDSRQYQSIHSRVPFDNRSSDINFKGRPDFGEKTSSTSPYRSRNQIIKEKIVINESLQRERGDASYIFLKDQSVPIIEETLYGYPTKRQFVSAQIKTTQVTPQKSSLSARQNQNASEQRRKSLIQKSQLLKEKLSKLNASSNTKCVQNQQTILRQKMAQKQNIVQNYTPKRYMTNSFRAYPEDLQKKDKSVTKKLNFQQMQQNTERFKGNETKANVERQSLRRKETNTNILSQQQGIKQQTKAQILTSGSTGEGALRKISELNERINSRLESILKNYG